MRRRRSSSGRRAKGGISVFSFVIVALLVVKVVTVAIGLIMAVPQFVWIGSALAGVAAFGIRKILKSRAEIRLSELSDGASTTVGANFKTVSSRSTVEIPFENTLPLISGYGVKDISVPTGSQNTIIPKPKAVGLDAIGAMPCGARKPAAAKGVDEPSKTTRSIEIDRSLAIIIPPDPTPTKSSESDADVSTSFIPKILQSGRNISVSDSRKAIRAETWRLDGLEESQQVVARLNNEAARQLGPAWADAQAQNEASRPTSISPSAQPDKISIQPPPSDPNVGAESALALYASSPQSLPNGSLLSENLLSQASFNEAWDYSTQRASGKVFTENSEADLAANSIPTTHLRPLLVPTRIFSISPSLEIEEGRTHASLTSLPIPNVHELTDIDDELFRQFIIGESSALEMGEPIGSLNESLNEFLISPPLAGLFATTKGKKEKEPSPGANQARLDENALPTVFPITSTDTHSFATECTSDRGPHSWGHGAAVNHFTPPLLGSISDAIDEGFLSSHFEGASIFPCAPQIKCPENDANLLQGTSTKFGQLDESLTRSGGEQDELDTVLPKATVPTSRPSTDNQPDSPLWLEETADGSDPRRFRLEHMIDLDPMSEAFEAKLRRPQDPVVKDVIGSIEEWPSSSPSGTLLGRDLSLGIEPKVPILAGSEKAEMRVEVARAVQTENISCKSAKLRIDSPRPSILLKLRLDPNRVASIQEESRMSDVLLGSLFVGEEEDSEDAAVERLGTVVSKDARIGLQLDAAHQEMVRRMLFQATWSRADLQVFADELDLMLDGALEQINDAFCDAFDELLFEGDDPLEVSANAHLLLSRSGPLTAMQ